MSIKALKPYAKVQLDQQNLLDTAQRANDNIEKALKGLTSSAIVAGTILNDISLTASPKRVEHKLGREPLGYLVIKRDSAQTVYDQQEERKDLFLNLSATAAVTVSLWVF